MSRESVMAFVNQAETNDDVTRAMKEVRGLEAITDLAKKHGYEFGVEELRPVVDMLRFLGDASRDPELATALENATDGASVVELAKSRGYEFGTAELAYLSVSDKGELSDSELENVAGGSTTIRNTSIRVSIQQTTGRQTTRTDFGSMLKSGLAAAADSTMSAGQIAAPYIPGGSVLSAAMSG